MRTMRRNSSDNITNKLLGKDRKVAIGSISFLSFGEDKPDPKSYISSYPVVSLPTPQWAEKHVAEVEKVIQKYLSQIDDQTKTIAQATVELTLKVSSLIQSHQCLHQRKLFSGRGLKEYREMFFLIDKNHQLEIKKTTLQIRQNEKFLEYLNAMSSCLKEKRDYSHLFIFVDLKGYLASIPNLTPKILNVEQKLLRLHNSIKTPSYLPPPDQLRDQLIYPTSSTARLFLDIESNCSNTCINQYLDKIYNFSNIPEEVDIMIDLIFAYAWRSVDFPFLMPSDTVIPFFDNTLVKAFEAEHIPLEYADYSIADLRNITWPYSPAVDHLQDLWFMINPVKMARHFYDTMAEVAKCAQSLHEKTIEIDFDTIFPLTLICVLVSGLISDPRILLYIAGLGGIIKSDSFSQVGASYAEAIITHIFGLDPATMASKP